MRDRIQRLEQESRALDPGESDRALLRDVMMACGDRFLSEIDTSRAFVETVNPAGGLTDFGVSEEGIPLEQVISLLEKEALLPGGHPAAAGHLAYLTGGGIFHAALADYIAAISNKFAGLFFTGPGPVRMENMMIRWVADLVGYPLTSAGTIASGGSIANLTAIATARDAHDLKGSDFASAVVYLTMQTHHCIEKALRVIGMREAKIRSVPVDERFRMRLDVLERQIAEDRAAGLKPWLIAATAGSTDTGAVDALDALADIAERHGCWFHIDAAYGGFFVMTEYGRELMSGIERSDSVVLDPHKSLFLSWGAGIVLLRDAALLKASFQETGHYLQDAADNPLELSPADISPELTKPFRALRMWLPLLVLGVKPFRAALEEKMLLARYFYEEIQKLGFAVGPAPDLSVVTFRWVSESADDDAINKAIVDALRRDGRIFISSTQLDGRFTLRVAPLSFRTHLQHIDLALQLIAEQVDLLRLADVT